MTTCEHCEVGLYHSERYAYFRTEVVRDGPRWMSYECDNCSETLTVGR